VSTNNLLGVNCGWGGERDCLMFSEAMFGILLNCFLLYFERYSPDRKEEGDVVSIELLGFVNKPTRPTCFM
jgi:hypothetical protein